MGSFNRYSFDPYGEIDNEAVENYKRSLHKMIQNAFTKSDPQPITKEEAFRRLDDIDITFIEQYLRKKKLDNIK
jgi:hypothetical protein